MMLKARSLPNLAVAVLALVLPMLVSCVASEQSARRDSTVVRIQQGALRGSLANGILSFKNIPYAASPVDSLRWKPPQAPSSWRGVRDATEFGPGCISIDGTKISQGRQLSGNYDIFLDVPLQSGTSEDCLRLNVWAPANAKRAAVMVWLQPIGNASFPLFDGGSFARDGVVFVSLDYRQLGLGNFAHPSLTKESQATEPLSRYQTMDQIAALRWIKRNIEAFGGDRDNVTVFGLSAGGASTLQLLTIPAARGLIDKAIVESGVGWWVPFSLSQMEELGSWAAQRAGLPGMNATAEQLRALPPEKLAQFGIYSVDGRMQKENGTDAIAAGRFADIPLLIGWTDFDGSSLRATNAEDYAAKTSQRVKDA